MLRAPSVSGQVCRLGWVLEGLGCSCFCSTLPLPSVCRDARGDIVFLVHGTRDSSSGADAVRTLLSNTVTSMGRLGPDGTQV